MDQSGNSEDPKKYTEASDEVGDVEETFEEVHVVINRRGLLCRAGGCGATRPSRARSMGVWRFAVDLA